MFDIPTFQSLKFSNDALRSDRAKTSCRLSPKLRSWTGVNCWQRKGKPSLPWSASFPSLQVRPGRRSGTRTPVSPVAASHCLSAGSLPCPHAATWWIQWVLNIQTRSKSLLVDSRDCSDCKVGKSCTDMCSYNLKLWCTIIYFSVKVKDGKEVMIGELN